MTRHSSASASRNFRKAVLAILALSAMCSVRVPPCAADGAAAAGPGKSRPGVAVLPFEASTAFGADYWHGCGSRIGASLSAMLTTELSKAGVRLVQRTRIDDILKEQDFGASGRVNRQSAARIGSVTGAAYLVLGTVTEFGMKEEKAGGSLGGIVRLPFGINGGSVKRNSGRVKIDVQLVNAETSEVAGSFDGTGSEANISVDLWQNWWRNLNFETTEWHDSQLGKAARKAVADVVRRLAARVQEMPDVPGAEGARRTEVAARIGTVRVAAVSGADEIVLECGSAQGVKVGDRFEIAREDASKTVRNEKGEVIFRKLQRLGVAEITEVQAQGAVARFTRADPGAGAAKSGDTATLLEPGK